MTGYAVVIPTTGRASLRAVLDALARGGGPAPAEIVVVDDRRARVAAPLPPLPLPAGGAAPIRVLASGGRGPAAARNTGWRATRAEWVAFVDDDVVPGADWRAALAADLDGLPADVAGSQGRVDVPLPAGRRPTDNERGTAGLASACWITADLAYRRSVLEQVGGFDERFPRAYREDSDLALRVLDAGYRLTVGQRRTAHPVRPADWRHSVRQQAGNADDVLMRRLHGRSWRARAGASRGRFRRHALTTGVAAVAAVAWAAGRRAVAGAAGRSGVAGVAAAAWAALTAEFAWRRIAPGPRTAAEVATMIATSVLIPPAACAHRIAGELRWAAVRPAKAEAEAETGGTAPVPDPAPTDAGAPASVALPAAVLFDRDGTLVVDVPYNTDPAAVRPVPGARAALDRLRRLGVPVGVVSNQSGVARGLISEDQLAAVNAKVDELLGPFDTWQVCVHGEADGCDCRKPAPGMVLRAAEHLGVPAAGCVVIGDIGADVAAATAAGARAILVPNAGTRRSEIRDAAEHAEVAADLTAAVDLAIGAAATSEPDATASASAAPVGPASPTASASPSAPHSEVPA